MVLVTGLVFLSFSFSFRVQLSYSSLFKVLLRNQLFLYHNNNRNSFLKKNNAPWNWITVTITFNAWDIDMDSHLCIGRAKETQPIMGWCFDAQPTVSHRQQAVLLNYCMVLAN